MKDFYRYTKSFIIKTFSQQGARFDLFLGITNFNIIELQKDWDFINKSLLPFV